MFSAAMRLLLILAALLMPTLARAACAEPPRTAIISAFAPEMALLRQQIAHAEERTIGGVAFVTGTLDGRPVLLFLSGMSMVNAAMTTQLALDHFPISRIVFSGVAGGVDPALDVGDVVVPAAWANYGESIYARAEGAGFAQSGAMGGRAPLPGFGMIQPRAATLQREGQPTIETKLWFEADPAMLAAAARAADRVKLDRCNGALCLKQPPRVLVGGHGVSAPIFMDNAAFRAYLHGAFKARATDMESAAVAQVAYVHHVPFIAFRSLSDLAGADPAENQWPIFLPIAAGNATAVVRAFLRELDK